MVGIFHNDQAVIRLIGAVLDDQHDYWIIARRYLTDTSLAELDTTRDTDTPRQAPSPRPATEPHQGHARKPTTTRDSVNPGESGRARKHA